VAAFKTFYDQIIQGTENHPKFRELLDPFYIFVDFGVGAAAPPNYGAELAKINGKLTVAGGQAIAVGTLAEGQLVL
jgi:hypothetical protein